MFLITHHSLTKLTYSLLIRIRFLRKLGKFNHADENQDNKQIGSIMKNTDASTFLSALENCVGKSACMLYQ